MDDLSFDTDNLDRLTGAAAAIFIAFCLLFILAFFQGAIYDHNSKERGHWKPELWITLGDDEALNVHGRSGGSALTYALGIEHEGKLSSYEVAEKVDEQILFANVCLFIAHNNAVFSSDVITVLSWTRPGMKEKAIPPKAWEECQLIQQVFAVANKAVNEFFRLSFLKTVIVIWTSFSPFFFCARKSFTMSYQIRLVSVASGSIGSFALICLYFIVFDVIKGASTPERCIDDPSVERYIVSTLVGTLIGFLSNIYMVAFRHLHRRRIRFVDDRGSPSFFDKLVQRQDKMSKLGDFILMFGLAAYALAGAILVFAFMLSIHRKSQWEVFAAVMSSTVCSFFIVPMVFAITRALIGRCGVKHHPHLRERLMKHYFPDAMLSEHVYIVQAEGLDSIAPGVYYRKTKVSTDLVYDSHIEKLTKGHGRYEKWGNTVVGELEDDEEWLRVGKYYLPMQESGVPVLHRVHDTEGQARSTDEIKRAEVDDLIQKSMAELAEKEPHMWVTHDDGHTRTDPAAVHTELVPSSSATDRGLMLGTQLIEDVPAGSTTLPVSSVEGFAIWDPIYIESAAGGEANAIKGFGSIELMYPLKFSHPTGTPISKMAHSDARIRELPPEYFAPAEEPSPEEEESKNHAVVQFEEGAEDSGVVKVDAHMLKADIEERPQVIGPEPDLPTTMALPVSSLLAPTCLSHTDAKTPDWRKAMSRFPKEDMDSADAEPPLALPAPLPQASAEPGIKAAPAPVTNRPVPEARALQACSWCGFKFEAGGACPRCGMQAAEVTVTPFPAQTRTRATGKAKAQPPSSDNDAALVETEI